MKTEGSPVTRHSEAEEDEEEEEERSSGAEKDEDERSSGDEEEERSSVSQARSPDSQNLPESLSEARRGDPASF